MVVRRPRSCTQQWNVGQHDSRQATHMEYEMHGWDVQRMLVDTPRSLMMMIMSLSKFLPQTPSFSHGHCLIGKVLFV